MTQRRFTARPALDALDPGPAFASIPCPPIWTPALDDQVTELARQAATLRHALARW